MKFLALLFPSLFSLLWLQAPVQQQTLIGDATIEGVITNTQQQPLAGVTITLSPGQHTVTTNTKGYYRLTGITPGTYDIHFTHPNAQSEVRKGVKLWSGQSTKIHLSMTLITTISAPVPLEVVMEEAEAAEYDRAVKSNYSSPVQMKAGNMAMGQSQMYDTYRADDGFNTEAYDLIQENKFYKAWDEPLSTFSIDVDNASYSNLRRFLTQNQEPPRDAIRIEEMVNYFDYTYATPSNDVPFSINMEMADCPWNEEHKLVHIGLQGKQIDYEELSASNLVFLIDVSGSMGHANKLPLVKESLKYLVDQLSEKDRIALVVYAGAAGLVLPSTPASEKETIKKAIDNLSAGGSTAGGAGIKLAYKVAEENLIEDGNNRVIIATDGDFNVGQSSNSEMVQLMEAKRKSGVYITVMGFGMGNYKDSKMEKIAQYGNGNYFYIDRQAEAQKVFGKDLRATLFTIAKDVKIQVEFNPALVESYRLIGYENRKLDNQDFEDDTKDAGELGAGHTVTALYEIVPAKGDQEEQQLKYQQQQISASAKSGELMTLSLRYKAPNSETSQLISQALQDGEGSWESTSDNFRWSASVALFGMLLRNSEFTGSGNYTQVLAMAKAAKGNDPDGLRQEFIDMAGNYIKQVAAK